MLKIIGRIAIILLVTVVFSTAIYFIVQSTMNTTAALPGGSEGLLSSGTFEGTGQGTGPRDGSGKGGGGGGDEQASFSNLTLLELLKDMAIIGLVTIVITLAKKRLPKKAMLEPADSE